jgi:hypothetical protein
MKVLLPVLIVAIGVIVIFCMSACSNKSVVYNKDAIKMDVLDEDSYITFDADNGVKNENQKEAGAIAALIPVAIDLGFKLTNNILEKSIKKFSSEYISQQSFIDNPKIIPNFTFTKLVNIGTANELALEISFTGKQVTENHTMVYYVKEMEVHFSKARLKKKTDKLDYTIELKPIFIVEGKKTPQELSPISISGVNVGGKTDFSKKIPGDRKKKDDDIRYRTDLIMIPRDSYLSEVHLKIIETNPRKVRLEQVLETFTNYKDDAKTIINNFVGEKDSKDPNSTVSNKEGATGTVKPDTTGDPSKDLAKPGAPAKPSGQN